MSKYMFYLYEGLLTDEISSDYVDGVLSYGSLSGGFAFRTPMLRTVSQKLFAVGYTVDIMYHFYGYTDLITAEITFDVRNVFNLHSNFKIS